MPICHVSRWHRYAIFSGESIKGWQSVANPLASDSCMSDDLQLPISHFWPFNVVKCCQMLSKKQPWQWPLTFEKNPWHLTKKSIAKRKCFWSCWFPAASWFWRSCPIQISNQESETKYLEDNISWESLYTQGFRTCMAPGSGATVPSNGSVSMCFFYMGRYISQHPLKPEESQNGSIIFLEQNFRKLTSKHDPREAGARRSLNFGPPKEEMNGEEVWQMHKLTLGADFRSRRRHRCLRFCILQIIGQRSQLDSMRSQFLLNVLDMANAPRQVARAKENMENIMMELHLGAWHTELQRECTQGSLVPLGQSAKDFNKLQWYLPGNRMVNGAKLVFHPNIKLRHVVFSDQGGSWHCLKYI